MSTDQELKQLLEDIQESLRPLGFSGRGLTTTLACDGFTWMITIDKIPRQRRYGVDVGLFFEGSPRPRRASGSAVLTRLASIAHVGCEQFDFREYHAALSLTTPFGVEERRHILRNAVSCASPTFRDVRTLDSLKKYFRQGNFREWVSDDASRRLRE